MAHDADFEQLSCLRLHTLGRVNHHDRGIRRHQRPVSILREILMPRRIQDIDAESPVIKLQDRRRYRDTSLFLDLHPVRNRMLCSRLSFDRSRLVDRASIQQELLGQRCFSGIRMGNDRKRPPLFYFICNIRHNSISPRISGSSSHNRNPFYHNRSLPAIFCFIRGSV